MLAMSNLYQLLTQYSIKQNGDLLISMVTLLIHFCNCRYVLLTPQQNMSKVRTSVEWVFGETLSYFSFLDFRKNLKIELSAVGKMYCVCTLLTNAHTCPYYSMTSSFFNVDLPTLEKYFV